MEINIFLIFIIVLIICGGLLFLSNLGKRNIVSNLWHSVEMGVIPAAIVAGFIYFFTTDVYIVYADGSHEEKNVLWSCKIKDEYGMWICPNGGDMKDTVFRVGHIGYLQEKDYDMLIDAFLDLRTKGFI